MSSLKRSCTRERSETSQAWYETPFWRLMVGLRERTEIEVQVGSLRRPRTILEPRKPQPPVTRTAPSGVASVEGDG